MCLLTMVAMEREKRHYSVIATVGKMIKYFIRNMNLLYSICHDKIELTR